MKKLQEFQAMDNKKAEQIRQREQDIEKMRDELSDLKTQIDAAAMNADENTIITIAEKIQSLQSRISANEMILNTWKTGPKWYTDNECREASNAEMEEYNNALKKATDVFLQHKRQLLDEHLKLVAMRSEAQRQRVEYLRVAGKLMANGHPNWCDRSFACAMVIPALSGEFYADCASADELKRIQYYERINAHRCESDFA